VRSPERSHPSLLIRARKQRDIQEFFPGHGLQLPIRATRAIPAPLEIIDRVAEQRIQLRLGHHAVLYYRVITVSPAHRALPHDVGVAKPQGLFFPIDQVAAREAPIFLAAIAEGDRSALGDVRLAVHVADVACPGVEAVVLSPGDEGSDRRDSYCLSGPGVLMGGEQGQVWAWRGLS